MRRILSITILLISTHCLQAQIKMGIKASPQITWTNSDSKALSSGGSKVNISYGLLIDYYFTENYAIGTEFGIGTFGGSIRPDSVQFEFQGNTKTLTDAEYHYHLQYITLPILIKMRTKEIGYFRYYGEFGLGMNFLYRSKADFSATGVSINNVDVNNPDPTDRFTLKDFSQPTPSAYTQEVTFFRPSFIIGAGIQYAVFSNTLLVAGVRFDNALTNFTTDSRWKANMSFLALNLGVLF